MSKRKVVWIVAVVVLVLLLAVASVVYNNLTSSENIESANLVDVSSSQEKATDFKVYTEQGEEVQLSDFIGKPVVINFWAECTACEQEMPHFQKAYESNPDIQFLMVEMVTSNEGTLEGAKRLVANNGYTFPVFFDNDGSVQQAYGVTSLPTSVFVDKDGVISAYAIGYLGANELAQGIESIR